MKVIVTNIWMIVYFLIAFITNDNRDVVLSQIRGKMQKNSHSIMKKPETKSSSITFSFISSTSLFASKPIPPCRVSELGEAWGNPMHLSPTVCAFKPPWFHFACVSGRGSGLTNPADILLYAWRGD